MKEIRDEEIPIDRANETVGETLSLGMWEFVLRRLAYPDIRLDEARGTIRYPGFIPIEAMLRETLEEMRRSGVDPRPCRVCAVWHDVNEAEGIFAKPESLEEFICEACAREMSAWTFFHDHLTA
jgi:hypothetical protein